jgi:zinc protease
VQAQVIAQLVYARDSITEQATGIGRLESVGLSWRLLDEELDALRAVSAEDIQAAARRLFQRERLTLAQILPEEHS